MDGLTLRVRMRTWKAWIEVSLSMMIMRQMVHMVESSFPRDIQQDRLETAQSLEQRVGVTDVTVEHRHRRELVYRHATLHRSVLLFVRRFRHTRHHHLVLRSLMLWTGTVLLETIVFHTREMVQTVEGAHLQAKVEFHQRRAEFHQRKGEQLQLMRKICGVRGLSRPLTAVMLQSVA